MMQDEERFENIRKRLKRKLPAQRYIHSVAVSYTAACLAMCFGEDPKKAQLAGLLHDCAKFCTPDELFLRCEKQHVPVGGEERKSPAMLHARYGSFLAEKKYGISDPDILNAISYHTTGRAGMSLLEKIVFTADFIEPGRDKVPELPRLRKLAFADLDRCVYEILEGTVGYLEKKGAYIHKDTITARDYYQSMGERS